jgi:hypothetical protein
MAFQNLRPSNQIYILHKDNKPFVEKATVVSVSMPTPKYPVPQQFGQAPEMVVDLVVRVGEQNITYQKLPANQDIADFGGAGMQVISTSRDAMNAEVMSMKQKSIDLINSVGFHQEMIAGCDTILQTLNPEYAEKQQQQAEINSLKDQMQVFSKSMTELAGLIADLRAEKRSSNPKKE